MTNKFKYAPSDRLDAVSSSDYVTMLQEASQHLVEIFEYAKIHGRIPIMEVQEKMIPSMKELLNDFKLSTLLLNLQNKDDYTLFHCISVGVLSTLMGKWLHLSDQEMDMLAVAGTLHDVGKLKIPDEILSKPGKLTHDEFELVKQHTVFGYEMIDGSPGASSNEALAALEHHEKVDGRGYPRRLVGNEISVFGKIVGIADVFQAMVSKRPYHNSLPIYQVLDQMHDGAFGKFDAHFVTLFITKIMENLVGETVKLTNGEVGVIIMINTLDPMRPLIKIDKEFIDLSKNYSINIVDFQE